MSIIIEQEPLYKTLPVGQDIIFTVSSDVLVATKYNVKFTAQIFIDRESSNIFNPTSLVATLKVTPNNTGRGIFSLQPILESYVSPQQEGVDFFQASISQFKGTYYSEDNPHPIHIIDKYCVNTNNVRYFGISFNIEYYDTADLVGKPKSYLKPFNSIIFLYFNGVINYDAVLQYIKGNYGFNLNKDKSVLNNYYGTLGKFLSDAPLTQYAKLTDYGTISFLNWLNTSSYSFEVGGTSATDNMVKKIQVSLFNNLGNQMGVFDIDCTDVNGGFQYSTDFAEARLIYFGGFPANFDGAGYSIWNSFKANTSFYTLVAFDDNNDAISQTYTVNIIGNSCKGFESIRLTWLNSFGTWDYYTFKKKSVKSLQTNRTSYTQQSGTWNQKKYKIRGYKGGKKNFRVNTKQLISINTDFIDEDEAVWFENLINSTDVYMLNGYDGSLDDNNFGITNKYVEPVTVTTSSYTRKTKANDKLIQYTFSIEKSHNKRTQSV